MAKNSIYQSHTKHITLKHYFIKEAIGDGEIQISIANPIIKYQIYLSKHYQKISLSILEKITSVIE